MIRHGEAAAGWGSHADPGLSERGHAQAKAAALDMDKRAPQKLSILSSPLLRCRETAAPLGHTWNIVPIIEPRVSEIPSPTGEVRDRRAWLRDIAAGTWSAVPNLDAWRKSVIEALLTLRQDTVIFSHYIAINVATGHALSDDRIVCFRPDNGSITVFQTSGSRLVLIEKGQEADTVVN